MDDIRQERRKENPNLKLNNNKKKTYKSIKQEVMNTRQ